MSLEITSSGGLAGQFFYRHALVYIGKVGGCIVLAGLYLISLLYLTNFRLGQWCRDWWAVRFGGSASANASGTACKSPVPAIRVSCSSVQI